MGSPNGGSSNNFGSMAGVITALNETNKKLRLLIDVLCCQNKNTTTTIITDGGESANTYNKINHYLVNQESGPFTIQANTVHCISYMVLNGELNISINNNAIVCPEGYSSSESVSGLIESKYIFTPVDASSSAIIITTSA